MPTTSELLSVEEAAAFLNLKSSTIREWVYVRRIPFVKLGARVMFTRSCLEQIIAASTVPANPIKRRKQRRNTPIKEAHIAR